MADNPLELADLRADVRYLIRDFQNMNNEQKARFQELNDRIEERLNKFDETLEIRIKAIEESIEGLSKRIDSLEKWRNIIAGAWTSTAFYLGMIRLFFSKPF